MENNHEEYPVPQDYTYILNDNEKLRQEMAANKSWTVTVEEDLETGDLMLPFPPDLLAQAGWDYGDVIVWNRDDHGNFILSKKEDNGISNTVGQNTN